MNFRFTKRPLRTWFAQIQICSTIRCWILMLNTLSSLFAIRSLLHATVTICWLALHHRMLFKYMKREWNQTHCKCKDSERTKNWLKYESDMKSMREFLRFSSKFPLITRFVFSNQWPDMDSAYFHFVNPRFTKFIIVDLI